MSVDALEIRKLESEHAEEISGLLARQTNSYREHFFPFEEESPGWFSNLLNAVQSDIYRGVFFDSTLVALFMLRGMDDGFERPAFGVLVDEAWGGRGLGRLCLLSALSECRLRGIPSCMLKVSPDNVTARRIYEKEGFVVEGVCERTGHEIFSICFGSKSGDGV